MLSQEQLEHLYHHLEKPFFSHRTGFENGISLDTMQKVTDIKNNADKMNFTDWKKWYEENKNNFAVIFSGLTTYSVPKSIIHNIVNDLDMFNPHKKPSYGYSQQDGELLKYIIANDIDMSDIKKIYDEMGMNFIFAVSLLKETANEETPRLQHISKEILEFFLIKTLEDFSKHSNFSLSDSRVSAILSFNDEEFLKTIFQDDKIVVPFSFNSKQKEDIRTILINNKFLSDDFKNEMFNAECNWFKLTYFTKEMAEEIYQSSVETYTDAYDKKRNAPKINMEREYKNAQNMIYTLLLKRALPEPLQYDLALRITSREDRKMDVYAMELYKRTDSERVLATALNLKSKTKETAYQNPNMPAGLIRERIETFCKKMQNLINKNQREKIPDIWDEHISKGLYSTCIEDKYYDLLMQERGYSTHMAIVLSDYTPQHIKDKIYKFLSTTYDMCKLPYDYQPRIKVSMDMMNYCDKESVPPKFKEMLKEYFKYIGPFTTSHSFFENSSIEHYHMTRAKEILSYIVNKSEKEDLLKLISFCEKSAGDCLVNKKQETILDQEKNIFKYMYLYLSEELKDREEIEKYKLTKDPSVLSKDNLENYIFKLQSEIKYDKNCCDYYLAIAEKGDEMYNLLIELEKREREEELKKEATEPEK